MQVNEVLIVAIEQAYYTHKPVGGYSQEQKNNDVGNFWSEGDQELEKRPSMKLPAEIRSSREFRKLVAHNQAKYKLGMKHLFPDKHQEWELKEQELIKSLSDLINN